MSDLLPDHDQTMLVFAARYAHTRNTGAAQVVVKAIKANWSRLSISIREQLVREARNEAVYNREIWGILFELEESGK